MTNDASLHGDEKRQWERLRHETQEAGSYITTRRERRYASESLTDIVSPKSSLMRTAVTISVFQPPLCSRFTRELHDGGACCRWHEVGESYAGEGSRFLHYAGRRDTSVLERCFHPDS